MPGPVEALSPEWQPVGQTFSKQRHHSLKEAFISGSLCFTWMHQLPDSHEPVPTELTLTPAEYYESKSYHSLLAWFAFGENDSKEHP